MKPSIPMKNADSDVAPLDFPSLVRRSPELPRRKMPKAARAPSVGARASSPHAGSDCAAHQPTFDKRSTLIVSAPSAPRMSVTNSVVARTTSQRLRPNGIARQDLIQIGVQLLPYLLALLAQPRKPAFQHVDV